MSSVGSVSSDEGGGSRAQDLGGRTSSRDRSGERSASGTGQPFGETAILLTLSPHPYSNTY